MMTNEVMNRTSVSAPAISDSSAPTLQYNVSTARKAKGTRSAEIPIRISRIPYSRNGRSLRSTIDPNHQLPRARPDMKAPRTVAIEKEVLPNTRPVSRTQTTS